jgi:hypothetical protein
VSGYVVALDVNVVVIGREREVFKSARLYFYQTLGGVAIYFIRNVVQLASDEQKLIGQ